MTKLAPVVIFAYKRPTHLTRVVESLLANREAHQSELIIFIDGPKSDADTTDVVAVRGIASSISGFKTVSVHDSTSNKGLARSIIDGVSDVLKSHHKVIVLEDDTVVSRYFLSYMNSALDLYQADDKVASIHGYVYPIPGDLPETFFLRGADCWGWATWSRAWSHFRPDGSQLLKDLQDGGLIEEFDFSGTAQFSEMLHDQIVGRNDSWAVRWYASAFLDGMLTLYPGHSLVQNIGMDGTGTHGGVTRALEVDVTTRPINPTRIALEDSLEARAKFTEYFRAEARLRNRSLWVRISGMSRRLMLRSPQDL